MFYKLSVRVRNNFFIKRVIGKLKRTVGRTAPITNGELVKKLVEGKSFADIGCMWGINGQNSFTAEDSGASEVIAVDVYPESKEFLAEKQRRNSKIRFVQGDINLLKTADSIGKVDVVLCSGVLYHTPDPFHLLTRLRAICGETLILNTCSIPEMPGLANAAVYYPFLDEKQRKIWNRGTGLQMAITGPYEPENGYGNWFWGMSPSCIESLLRSAGFFIEEKYIYPFDCAFVCGVAPIQFLAESGEWITPQDEKFKKFQK